MGRRGLRRNYNPVSSTAEEADDAAVIAVESEGGGEEDNNNNNTADSNNGDVGGDVEAPRRRRDYQTVAAEEEAEDEEEEGTKVTIVILDPAQKKFFIPAYTHWSISKFKRKGAKIHKVAPPSQRLIYRGQLLQDSSTLEGCGLSADKLIVHLFPKPRVVIQQQQPGVDEEQPQPTGAHIPQIVLNPDEAEQRAHILVLGSADFLEAQNNVKLFSFLLLVISSIELFNLLLILMGVPPDNGNGNNSGHDAYNTQDDFFHIDVNNTADPYNSRNYNNNMEADPYQEAAIQRELQTWQPRSNIDLIISAFGIYVAMLGIRATNETTLRLAQQYLVGTAIVGIAWMMFNYWFTVHVDEEFDQLRRDERHNHTNATNPVIYDDDAIPYKTEMEYYQQNLSLMMIPGMVWVLCCLRAYQFQSLLEEAEQEAEERIRNELAQHNAHVHGGEGEDDEDDVVEEDEAATTGGTELELQNRSAVIT
ncbi:expressed unknown protein [Seminavis robusta]|uniref:Ubiquitin-like domain-containing protein n=1 Tax=Seminavis robusta TaxID=568900 RepID=A0A9N8HID9_9STRA|nr:expressed unknown protein [Seminavis robusta]|eukprot:Sro494_g154290.1 n/a (477) ;mRNA; r:39776-41206